MSNNDLILEEIKKLSNNFLESITFNSLKASNLSSMQTEKLIAEF